MSRYDYSIAQQLQQWPFAALIMAAVLKADTANALVLHEAFPALFDETQARYCAPGGVLSGETGGRAE